jgi:hypothetical protein
VLTVTRIIVGQQMGSARVPSYPKSLSQFQSYVWITLDVADVSRLHAVLCHKPELVSDAPIADWRAPWLPRFPPSRFEQRISGQGQSNRKRELDRRVQHVFLKRVDNAVFHFESFAHITLMSRFSRTGFGKPRLVTFNMARPTHSVVVT